MDRPDLSDRQRRLTNVKWAIDNGAAAVFPREWIAITGERRAIWTCPGKIISLVRQNGLAAGVASHSLDTPKAVEKNGLAPDFYFKTFNSVGYQSQGRGKSPSSCRPSRGRGLRSRCWEQG